MEEFRERVLPPKRRFTHTLAVHFRLNSNVFEEDLKIPAWALDSERDLCRFLSDHMSLLQHMDAWHKGLDKPSRLLKVVSVEFVDSELYADLST